MISTLSPSFGWNQPIFLAVFVCPRMSVNLGQVRNQEVDHANESSS